MFSSRLEKGIREIMFEKHFFFRFLRFFYVFFLCIYVTRVHIPVPFMSLSSLQPNVIVTRNKYRYVSLKCSAIDQKKAFDNNVFQKFSLYTFMYTVYVPIPFMSLSSLQLNVIVTKNKQICMPQMKVSSSLLEKDV